VRKRGEIETLFYEGVNNAAPIQGQKNLALEVLLDIRDILNRIDKRDAANLARRIAARRKP
jgi:hypothetical protein